MDAIDAAQDAEVFMLERAIAERARPRTGTRSASRGICAEYGGPISPARLAALPEARACIDCQR